MANGGNVKVLHSVEHDDGNGWKLSLQYGTWIDHDGTEPNKSGYRFMWSKKDLSGKWKLMPYRGGARVPSLGVMNKLIGRAIAEGWGHHDDGHFFQPDRDGKAEDGDEE